MRGTEKINMIQQDTLVKNKNSKCMKLWMPCDMIGVFSFFKILFILFLPLLTFLQGFSFVYYSNCQQQVVCCGTEWTKGVTLNAGALRPNRQVDFELFLN